MCTLYRVVCMVANIHSIKAPTTSVCSWPYTLFMVLPSISQ